MIERIIYLNDGRSIKITASGGSPRRYRNIFGRDLFMDMDKVTRDYFKVMEEGNTESEESEKESSEDIIKSAAVVMDSAEFDEEDMTIIENCLFMMSSGIIRLIDGKEIPHADVVEMLDDIKTQEVFMSIPEIVYLWFENLGTIEPENNEESNETENNQKKTNP